MPRKLEQGGDRRTEVHRVLCAALLVWMAALPAPAGAQTPSESGWGVRMGLSSRPSQFIVGMHLDLGELAQHLRLVPNADVGFGDDWTYVTANSDLVYSVPFQGAGRFYFGGTAGLIYWRSDHDEWYSRSQQRLFEVESYGTDIGAAGVLGWDVPVGRNSVFLEAKIGITSQYPEAKVMLGYTIRR
jgi:hypothetical protein